MFWIDVLKVVVVSVAVAVSVGLIYFVVRSHKHLKTYWLNSDTPRSSRQFQIVMFMAGVVASAAILLPIGTDFVSIPWGLESKAVEERAKQNAADALARLTRELDTQRAAILQAVQQKVGEGKLEEAKLAMAKYRRLDDPVLMQVTAQIDKEILIAKLIDSTKSDTDPNKLLATYQKLAELVPNSPEYRVRAESFAATVKAQAKENAAEEAKRKAYQAKYAAAVARIDGCVSTGDCAFRVWGAAVGPAKMGFWVLESQWRSFDALDKEALRGKFFSYLSNMQSNPANYAANSQIGAGVPRSAPAYSVVVDNIRNASGWIVVVSANRSASGALGAGREIKNF